MPASNMGSVFQAKMLPLQDRDSTAQHSTAHHIAVVYSHDDDDTAYNSDEDL
jgi:hypothetical protein